jgi:hypothetical protein
MKFFEVKLTIFLAFIYFSSLVLCNSFTNKITRNLVSSVKNKNKIRNKAKKSLNKQFNYDYNYNGAFYNNNSYNNFNSLNGFNRLGGGKIICTNPKTNIYDCDKLCLCRFKSDNIVCPKGVFAKADKETNKLECVCQYHDQESTKIVKQDDICYTFKHCKIKSAFESCKGNI